MRELIYGVVAILVVFILFLNFNKKWKSKAKENFVLIIAFVFIFFGLFFSNKPAIGYSLLTLGAVIAIIERILSRRKQ